MSSQKINRVTVALLLLGFASALAIYLLADPTLTDPLLGDPRANKKYLHELQVIGGKANMLSAEFQNWFAGLWHGRSLAGTVAVLTAGVTLAFRFLAMHPGEATPADGQTPPSGPA